jgi:hypothetical protein
LGVETLTCGRLSRLRMATLCCGCGLPCDIGFNPPDGRLQSHVITSRAEAFRSLWALVSDDPTYENLEIMPRATIPYMDEPWYC